LTEPVQSYPRWMGVMPCYLSVQDRQLRIIEANNLFVRDFGEHVGNFCYQVYKDNQAPCPDCPVLQTFQDGQVHSGEEKVTTREGKVIEVVVTSTPLLDENGRVSSVIEMSTNISEVKSLRRKLSQTRRDYKRLFESVPCYICVLDRDLVIQEANTLYKEHFDSSRGTHCYDVCKGRKNRCDDCLVEKTFADGQSHSSEERLTTRNGHTLNLVVHSMPVRDEERNITAVMEVFTDITEVKRLQHQLTMMGRAVAGMAHRIKNILMGLEGGIFVVNTGMESDDREAMDEGWEMVERNVKRVSRLVKDLLYCSKERKPSFEDDVCPREIVRQVHELYTERAAEAGIDLRLDLDQQDLRGTFDPDGLYNLLVNLVGNAIDACRFDPDEKKRSHTIQLRCRRQADGAVAFEVEDNGAGIPDDVAAKVFEDFFSTKGTEGTGIGLLVVQKVAEEHGGKVTFDTKPGIGTRFTVTIPPRQV
jgi:PAS domain S-box-containing protein